MARAIRLRQIRNDFEGVSVAGSAGRVVVDIRSFDPAHRRALIFTLVDKLLELGVSDALMLVTDYEPSGIGYQIDLRRETRGRFVFTFDQRSDGAWVSVVAPKKA
jgi:uncharacterized protein (DUF2249 family)